MLPMRSFSSAFSLVAFGSLILAGTQAHADDRAEPAEVIPPRFFTAERQAQLTPERMLEKLKERNQEFAKGEMTLRNTSERVRKAANGQYPGAVILSCLDSRVPVEDVFHSGIGDLFVARVAGNTANPEVLGSLEFACNVAGAKVIVVMGHNNCGAVKAAIDDVQVGNITAMLRPIRTAVEKLSDFEGEKTSGNAGFVEAVCRENVRTVIDEIRAKSPILKEMEEQKKIAIVGAEYLLESGVVEFFDAPEKP